MGRMTITIVRRSIVAFFLLASLSRASADDAPRVSIDDGLDPSSIDEDCSLAIAPAARAPVAPTLPESLPGGRSIGALTSSTCHALLTELGIRWEDASAEGGSVAAIEQPVRIDGSVGVITVRPHGGDPRSIHAILDCRLVVALHAWGPTLRDAGFVGIEHVSVFRPGARVAGTSRASGHSHALAIDALRFVRADGTTFSVLDDWVARTRGADPCAAYDEPTEARSLRDAICAGAAAELFEVIITPHHDDAHANHVHLEVVPGVDWTALR
jgi:hypothetical protein